MTDKQRNQYLLRKYGITLEERTRMEREQGGVCAICGKPPLKLALSVDHDHKWKLVKPETKQVSGIWLAKADYRHVGWMGSGRTKREAVAVLKSVLKKVSVRGLLCWTCNTGLQKWRDNAAKLASAAEYLNKFNGVISGETNQA